MMRVAIFAAAMVIGCASYAGAGEIVKQDKAPAVKAQKMSDSDMDKVTAGSQSYHSSDSYCCYYPGTWRSSESSHANVPYQGSIGIGKR